MFGQVVGLIIELVASYSLKWQVVQFVSANSEYYNLFVAEIGGFAQPFT